MKKMYKKRFYIYILHNDVLNILYSYLYAFTLRRIGDLKSKSRQVFPVVPLAQLSLAVLQLDKEVLFLGELVPQRAYLGMQ